MVIEEIIIIETVIDQITAIGQEADGTIIGQVIEIDMITGPFSQDKTHYLMGEMNLDPDLTLE